MLFENRGKRITREQILSYIWDNEENFVNDNTLTVYIKRIREKIEEDPNKPEIIKTVRGLGYTIAKCQGCAKYQIVQILNDKHLTMIYIIRNRKEGEK